jgi:hypothetical protein
MSPVLEITLLRTTPSVPVSSSQTLTALQMVRNALAEKVTPTHSRFYQGVDRPSDIYILGIWPSLESHQGFLSDEGLRNRVLGAQEGLMDFIWGVHVELASETGGGDADTAAVVERTKRMLSDAKGLEVERWFVAPEYSTAFLAMLQKQESEGKEELKGFKIVEGWRNDTTDEGVREYVQIRGWEKVEEAGRGLEDHEGFVKGGWLLQEEMDVCERVEVNIARNMEG